MKDLILGFSLVAAFGFGALAVRNSQPSLGAPNNDIHIMRQWEDGSYKIEYKNGSIITGCVEGGLCND